MLKNKKKGKISVLYYIEKCVSNNTSRSDKALYLNIHHRNCCLLMKGPVNLLLWNWVEAIHRWHKSSSYHSLGHVVRNFFPVSVPRIMCFSWTAFVLILWMLWITYLIMFPTSDGLICSLMPNLWHKSSKWLGP